ncbi:MAG: biotin transporter BioY [Treponema sp.]|nr:biotin transporter BioY [Treponema sp.]
MSEVNVTYENEGKEKGKALNGMVFAALFAALISCAAFFHIPLPGGVPIVLQDMLGLLSGLLLGPVWGTLSVFVFLILGSIGLPVFSGKAGIQVILSGPTGGFLVGYMLGALVAGLVLRFTLKPEKDYSKTFKWIMCVVAAVLAEVVLFACGIVEFLRVTGKGMDVAMKACVIPFIPGMIIKTTLNVILAGMFRKKVQNLIRK